MTNPHVDTPSALLRLIAALCEELAHTLERHGYLSKHKEDLEATLVHMRKNWEPKKKEGI